jgi:pyruvate ferredoxin oxidoreductase beta subunit
MTVLAMAGDGGTADIGIQALSGAAERNEDFIYLCYDNEAYMNTGTQRSGLTPAGARTTTTWTGKKENPKDMPAIMEAHGIPYVASTSAAFPTDVYDKVAKARGIRGLRYIHMNTPCPSGWGFDPKDTVRLGKLAVDAGLVVLFEVEDGAFRLTGRSASLAKTGKPLTPVADYLATQSRFRGMDVAAIAAVQAWTDERWARYVARAEGVCPA